MQKERIDRPKKYTACIYSQHIQRLLSFPFTQIHSQLPQRRNLNNFPVNPHFRFWLDSLSVGWLVGQMKMMSIGKNGKSNLDKVPECQCLKISLQSGEASQPTLRRGWGWGGEPTSSLNQSSLDKSQLNFSDHSY